MTEGECSNAVFEETAIYKSHVVELLIFPRLIMILNTYAVKASIFLFACMGRGRYVNRYENIDWGGQANKKRRPVKTSLQTQLPGWLSSAYLLIILLGSSDYRLIILRLSSGYLSRIF